MVQPVRSRFMAKMGDCDLILLGSVRIYPTLRLGILATPFLNSLMRRYRKELFGGEAVRRNAHGHFLVRSLMLTYKVVLFAKKPKVSLTPFSRNRSA